MGKFSAMPVDGAAPRPVPDMAERRAALRRIGVPLLVALAAVVVIVIRRPDAITRPQFWAEDGSVWFGQAYHYGGLHVLFAPYAGYLHLSSRLVAWIAQVFPPAQAPLVFNVFGIAIQAIPAVVLATDRFDRLIPDWRARALLIGLYLALPNSAEVHVTVTNSQWHLALLLPLLVVAAPPRTWWGRGLDATLFLVAALSGPYCLALLPFLGLYWWFTGRDHWRLALLGLCACASAVEAGVLLTAGSNAHRFALSGHPSQIVRLIAGQIVVGLVAGQHGYAALMRTAAWRAGWEPYALAGATAAAVTAAAAFGRAELRLFLGYAVALLAVALLVPDGPDSTWLAALAVPGQGQRYFLIPMLALVAVLTWLVSRRQPAARIVAGPALACILVIGVRLDWTLPPYRDFGWSKQIAACLARPAGKSCSIRINPPGSTFGIDRR